MRPLSEFLRDNARWLAAGFVLTFASSFGQTFFISVFAGEIRAAFGLSHGGWGALYAVATTASAVVMIWAGGLTDQFRIRHISIGILCGLAFAAASMAWVNQIWQLGVVIFLLRLFGQGLMGHSAMVAMARWFVATRGRAVSVAGLGVALGEAALPILFVALLAVVHWRTLWGMAAMGLLLLVPVMIALLRHERTPQSFATGAGSVGMYGRMWGRAQVLRHPVFWLMLPALLGPAAWNTSFFFHQVHLAESQGWGHAVLVALFPVFTATAVAAMVFAGWLVDRIGSYRLAAGYLWPMVAGYLFLALVPAVWGGALALVLMGLSVGMHVTMMATFWAEAFGTAHLGRIRSMVGAVMVLGTAIGPAVTGALIDAGLPYAQQGGGIAAWFAAAAILAGISGRLAARARLD